MRKLNAEKLNRTLRARLNENLAACRISGAQLLVRQGGETLCELKAGYQDVRTREPLRDDAIYRLASMTKPITGIAALIAVQNGWFDVYDNVADYLPEFADMQVAVLRDGEPVVDHPAKSPLKIYQMLSHCNGILCESPVGEALFRKTPAAAFSSIETTLAYCAAQPLAFDPGTYTAYTGYASFDAIAHIIELKSGLSYAEFLQKYLFSPLVLHDLTFTPDEAQWSRMIVMSDRAENPAHIAVDMGRHIFEGFPLTYTCAGASLCGSLHDYGVIAELLRGAGSFCGVRIFDSALLERLTTPYVPPETPNRDPISSWGLGVRVVDQPGVLPIGSFGWSGAYGTHFWVDPENNVTAVYLRNSRWYDSHGGGELGMQFERDVMSCLE